MFFLQPVALIRNPTGDIAKKLGRKQTAGTAYQGHELGLTRINGLLKA
jgi:hypothetical protein